MFRPSKKEKIILAVLAGLIVIIWGPALFSRPKERDNRRPSASAVPSSGPSQIQRSAGGPIRAEGEPELPGWGENPFVAERGNSLIGPAPVVLKGGSTGYSLSGILWDPQAPSAIINNQVVAVGEQVDGWRVIEIQRDRVILSDGDSTQTLRVE